MQPALIKRPLLAPQDTPSTLPTYWDFIKGPVFVSPKIDGIRALNLDIVRSRTMKPIPSYQVQDDFAGMCLPIDFEITAGAPNRDNVYNTTQSHVMSANKPTDIFYHAFDCVGRDTIKEPYQVRLEALKELAANSKMENLRVVGQHIARSKEEILEIESYYLDQGYEGVMIRGIDGYYKEGRATMREGLIFKLKRWIDSEAVVIGFVERMHNTNPQQTNELGLTKRSSAKEGLKPAGMVGKFVCIYKGEETLVAPGTFTHAQLIEIWNNQEKFLNRFLSIRYFGYGIKNLPRQPRARGWRDPIDM